MASESTIEVEEHELDDAALEALAEAYAQAPPTALRERVIMLARREDDHRRAMSLVGRSRLIGMIAAGVALALGGLLARELRLGRERETELATMAQQNALLTARLDEQGRTLAGMREALDAQSEVLRLVGGPRILTATLAPQGGVAGSGRVLVDAESGRTAIVLSGLAPPAAGKAYELWAIRGKRPPEPAGLIAIASELDAAAARMPPVERPAEVTAFAVSIEPSGGSKSPTGPIVLVGPVAG